MKTPEMGNEEEGIHEMAVMDLTGDTKIIWDPENDDEVENAERMFNEFVKEKKFAAFSVGKKGKKDEQIKKFDPEIDKMILVPPICGG